MRHDQGVTPTGRLNYIFLIILIIFIIFIIYYY
jgi:hypothetical protein